MTSHHIPERTCISCRQTKPKWELVRIVRSIDGQVEIDAKNREPGRGAYLCRTRQCWELALKEGRKDRIGRSLRTSLTAENRKHLSDFVKQLPCA